MAGELQPVYKGRPKADYLKKFQNFRTHALLHYVSLCATAETIHICHSANVYFLKFHAPTLRGK